MPPLRLLIADDNAEFRNRLELALRPAPDMDIVAVARDGQEAVELCRQFQPDVAVIDIHMPRLDGLAALRQIKQACPGVACMAMSHDQERETLRQAMDAGARDYLVKPFSDDEVLSAIRRMVVMVSTSPAALTDALTQQALACLRTWRTDDDALRIYRSVLGLPVPEPALLTRLAAIFLACRDWQTVRDICDRMLMTDETAAT